MKKLIILFITILMFTGCSKNEIENYKGYWDFENGALRLEETTWKIYDNNKYLIDNGTIEKNKNELKLKNNNEVKIIIKEKNKNLELIFNNNLQEKFGTKVVAKRNNKISIEEAEGILRNKYGNTDEKGDDISYMYEATVKDNTSSYYVFRVVILKKNNSKFDKNIFISIDGSIIKENKLDIIYEDEQLVELN